MFDEPPCPAGWSLLPLDPARNSSKIETEFCLWDDPAGALTVLRLGAKSFGRYRLCFNNEITLDVMTDAKLIIEWPAKSGVHGATRNHVFADQLYPRILAHEGNLVLHAGAFEAHGGCILIVGSSGRGKSSLVTSFDQAGFPLLGDDALVVSMPDGVAYAKAVYQSLRLFPDSVNALFKGGVGTSEVAHYTAKQRINIPVTASPPTQPKPILAMFMLLEPPAEDEVLVDRLSVANACMALVQSSFALDPSDAVHAVQRLELASALARQIPAFAISYPRNYARLPAVREAIMDQCTRLKQ